MRYTGIATSLALLSLLACGRQAAAPSAGVASAEADGFDSEKILNVYSWMDYIAPETVPNFERETGIKVRYATYDNNEVLETKLLTGHTDFDVVIPTENFFDRQLGAGAYRKLDKGALSNLGNLDPDVMKRLAIHDPGNQYAVPYMWSTTGLGYNVDAVRRRLGAAQPNSWGLLLDPQNAAKLQDCGITIIDSPLDVFESTLIYLGRDPSHLDPADIAAAAEVLRKIRPYVRYIEPAQYISDLASGAVCLSLGWSGDIKQARSRAKEASTGARIAYLVPREGALMTVDMMAVPADAPHPRNAQIWINYLMRPDVIAGITNAIGYPNANSASLPLVDADIKSDESIYPGTGTQSRLFSNHAVPLEASRLVTREWTRFRTGY